MKIWYTQKMFMTLEIFVKKGKGEHQINIFGAKNISSNHIHYFQKFLKKEK